MNKFKQALRLLKNQVGKAAKRWSIEKYGRQFLEDMNRKEDNLHRRRRNRVKAMRFVIRYECLECRQEAYANGYTCDTATDGYKPFDNYYCGRCRQYMRGGKQ